MSVNYQIIFCSCPDRECAEKIAQLLVREHLAACVNIIPGITSVYTWQGQIESAQEHLLLVKAQQDYYALIESKIRHHHPYEIPEIIALPIEAGLPEYLQWIDSCHSLKSSS